MFDAKRILDQLVSSGVAGGLAGGVAGGALANSLTSKKVRKVAGSALQLGGLALVGGVAYKAWQTYQRGSTAGTDCEIDSIPEGSAFLPAVSDTSGANALSLLLVRAVISAAKADGKIDAGETQVILQQINNLDLTVEDKAFLLEEYNRPLDILGLAAAVDTVEHAAEVYTASLLALDPPSAPEVIYLGSLADALGLESRLVEEIHATVHTGREAA